MRGLGYNIRIQTLALKLSWTDVSMQGSLVEAFQETLGRCFASSLRDMLGGVVCESVFGLLEKNGIRRTEISNRFDDTVAVLTRALGSSSRVLVHRTVVEMFRQYSQRADFSYQDSLRERLTVLKETVVAQHLVPRALHEGFDFDSVAITPRTGGPMDHQRIYG